jgi:hypothetical protein
MGFPQFLKCGPDFGRRFDKSLQGFTHVIFTNRAILNTLCHTAPPDLTYMFSKMKFAIIFFAPVTVNLIRPDIGSEHG